VRLLLCLLALPALLVGGLAGFWWLGGPDAHRWATDRVLELALGRDVHLDGAVELQLGAEPLVELNGLRVASPAWAETPNQLQVARARFQIALRPLLDRVLLFPVIDLEGVTVALEVGADGRSSWQSGDDSASGSGFGVPLFGRLSISDATVTYHDQRDGRRLRAHLATLTQHRDAASGGMQLDARGDIDGEAFRIAGTSGTLEAALDETAVWPLDLEVELPSIDAKLAGTVGDVARAAGLDLRLEARSPSLQAAAQAWQLSLPMDAQATLAATLRGDLAALVVDAISAEVQAADDSSLTLAGTASTAGSRLQSFDLTSTLKVPKPSAFADLLGTDLSELGALRGEAELSLSEARIAAQRLTLDAADFGGLHVEGSGALGTLAADGALSPAPGLSFTAAMSASRPMLALLDPNVPELGPIRASARLLREAAGYRLDGIELDLGTADKLTISAQGTAGPLGAADLLATELALDVRFAWPSSRILESLVAFDLSELGSTKGTFALGGTLADLRLHDARLEASSPAGIALTATGGIASVRTKTPLTLEGIAFVLDGNAPSTTLLARRLGYPCPDFGPLQARAGLQGGQRPLALTAIQLAVGPAAEPAIEASGAIGDLNAFEKLELTGDFRVPTTDLLACAGIHGKTELGRLHGKMRLSDADGSFGVEHLEAEVRETDLLSLTMQGVVDDLEQLDQVSFETSLEVPKVADLAAVFDADGIGLDRFQFDGKLTGGDRRFDANGQATVGETKFDGTLAGDFRGARPSFDAHLHSPMVRLVDLGLRPGDSSEPTPTVQAATVATGELFGREPFPLAALDKADLDLEVQLDSIEGVSLAVDQASAHVVLQDG
jgi:hypothetical protein